jgi:hypothetical protein
MPRRYLPPKLFEAAHAETHNFSFDAHASMIDSNGPVHGSSQRICNRSNWA